MKACACCDALMERPEPEVEICIECIDSPQCECCRLPRAKPRCVDRGEPWLDKVLLCDDCATELEK